MKEQYMTRETNSNIKTSIVMNENIHKFMLERGIKLPKDYIRFLLINNPKFLHGKAVFCCKNYGCNEDDVIPNFIELMFPLDTSPQQNKQEQLGSYNNLLKSASNKEFCLSDWQFSSTWKYLPIGITKNHESLICLSLEAADYGKIYLYTCVGWENVLTEHEGVEKWEEREVYIFYPLADNFTDLVLNLVEPELALAALQLPEELNIEYIRTLHSTARLQYLNKVASTIYKANKGLSCQNDFQGSQFIKKLKLLFNSQLPSW